MRKSIVLVALTGALIAAAWRWQHERPVSAPSPAQVAAEPAQPASAAPAAATASAPRFPVVSMPPPSTSNGGWSASLSDLFGAKAVSTLFRVDDFAHRFVASVDNLGRSAAPSSVWPVQPVAGRFQTAQSLQGGDVIGPDNGLRYAPYVVLLEQADLQKIARVYKDSYPEFQRAYEELGFPNGYFNDRFVEVVDQLLATPEPAWPVHVHRPLVAGRAQPSRPWVLYEFDDPVLSSMSAGQHILARMGPINERRVKARLAKLRELLVAP